MIFPLIDPASYFFNPYALPPLCLAIVILSLGQLFILFESRNPVNISFSLFTANIGVWFFCYAMVYFSAVESAAIGWARIAALSVAFLPVTVYGFTLRFLHIKEMGKKTVLLSWIFSSIFGFSALKGHYLVEGVHRYFWGFYAIYGWMGILLMFYLTAYFMLGFWHLQSEYKRSEFGIQKTRIKLVIMAVSVTSLGMVDFIAKFKISFYPFGYLPISISLFIFYWLIRRYNLVDLSPEFAAKEILKTMQGAVLVLDMKGNIRVVNQAACEMLGYDIDEARELSILSVVNARQIDPLSNQFTGTKNLRMVWMKKDGQKVEVSVSTSLIDDQKGFPLGIVCVALEITELVCIQEALRVLVEVTTKVADSENRDLLITRCLETICRLKNLDLGQAWIPDETSEFLSCSPKSYYSTYDMTSFRKESLEVKFRRGEGIPGLIWHSNYPRGFSDLAKSENSPRGIHSFDVQFRSAFGFPIVIQDRLLAVFEFFSTDLWCPDHHFLEAVQKLSTHLAVVLERIQMQDTIEQQAIRDSLTDLYNRRYFDLQFEHELERSRRSGNSFALIICDVDNFKVVNDICGHQVGDVLLKAIGNSVLLAARGSDLSFRWRGDEFAVIVTGVSREGARIVGERIRTNLLALNERAEFGNNIDLSVGIALFPEHGNTCESLIQSADRALYIAKKSEEKIQIGQDKYRLDSGTIKIVFQRIISIPDGGIIGYEALSRDPNEQYSVHSLFKKYQAIGKLMELKRICFMEQIKKSEKIGLSRVFVNIDFILLDQMEPFAVPPHTEVILEISELDALHDIARHLLIAEKWRGRGFKFAIDDFGAGFISLPFMAKLMPDYIKLDRSTMLQAVSNPAFRIFATDLVRTLKHFVVSGIIVEGVETPEELQVVKEMGIDIVQGFLFGEPAELEETHTEDLNRPISITHHFFQSPK